MNLNPLELQSTPDKVLASVPDLDPWAEQFSWVMAFLETFFEQVATNPLADRKQTLRRAIQEAYQRKGITTDPSTHGKESPTVRDVSQLREVNCTLRASERFSVPISDGYSVYGALLNVLTEVDTDVSASVHDSSIGSLHNSGLVGYFGSSKRAYHKTVLPDEEYQLSLGIVHPDDQEVFQTLVSALVLKGKSIELSHGKLRVERFESENATYEELVAKAGNYDDPTIEIEFQTPTCIEETGDVTSMFPHRWAVFNSLLRKWNQSCPEKLQLDIDRTTVESHVIEKPDPGLKQCRGPGRKTGPKPPRREENPIRD